MPLKQLSFLHLTLIIAILFSLTFIINAAENQTTLKSRAQSAMVQPQCSPQGEVQFAISFTNPESFSIDLLAEVLLQTQTQALSRNYINISPGQTRTGIIRTNLTSLSNAGDVVFTWSRAGDPTDTKNINASFNPITCTPPSISPTPQTTQASDNDILALTPLPPQPQTTPEPFYQKLLNESGTRFQTLIYNLIRFFSAFTTG